MDREVKENYIINDIENVKTFIENLAGYEIDVEEMIKFIETEKWTEFCFSSILQIRELKDKDAVYVWLDTGYITPKGDPIFISLKKASKNEEPYYFYAGYYVGIAGYLARGISEHNQYQAGTIKKNLEYFKNKYQKKLEQRTKKHLGNNNSNIDKTSNPDNGVYDLLKCPDIDCISVQ